MLRRYAVLIGAVVGAVLFPTLQAVLDVGFHKMFVSPSMSQRAIMVEALTLLQLNAFRWLAHGTVVGGLSGGLLAAWLSGNMVHVRRFAVLSLLLVAYCVFGVIQTLHWAFTRPSAQGFVPFAVLYSLPLNLTFQCAIVLAVAGRTAANHLNLRA